MTPQDLLLEVFCLVDDELQALDLGRLRRRGPLPALSDSEVITIELVGELWGLHDDQALYRHFRLYHGRDFPALARVHRTTFARQAANLWQAKERLRQRLARRLSGPGQPWLLDSFPLPVCRFARARSCRRFRGLAAFGYDAVAAKPFYGFRVHLRASPDGVVQALEVAPADVSDLAMAPEMAPDPVGVGIGDRNYWDPKLQEAFAAAGGAFLAPYRHASRDPNPQRSRLLGKVRRVIEVVIGQLVEQYQCRRLRVRDVWHLQHRLIRKALSHTVMLRLNVQLGHEPLHLATLRAA